MASESSSSRSSSSVDSYIGSLISLTSKSEIRYEGVLYNINTDESSIGLRNVRSFGTEGRKQDGPQIPPSDKVYEYILFRGSDIKDLQVKSSPPVQPPTQQINNDPAIIQSHYPQVSSSTSLPSAVSGSAADLSSHSAQFGLPGSNFQGALPLYQPGANLGPWGASPSQPTANGSGLAMPMYWQGYYSPNGLPMHQQSLLRPPSGLSMPPSMQHPLQYPNFNASMPTGASHMPGPNFPEVPSPFLPASSYISNSSLLPPTTLPSSPSMLPPTTLPSSSSFTPSTTLPSSSSLLPPAALPSSSSLLPPAALPSNSSLLSPVTLTSMLPSATSTTISSNTSQAMMPNRTPSSTPTSPPLSAGVPPPLITSSPELSAIIPPVDNMPNAVSGQTLAYKSASLSTSTVGASNTNLTGLPTPTLSSPLSSQATHKDVEVVQISQSSLSEPSAPVAIGAQSPILPLPARPHRKVNGDPYQNRHGYRGRERGRGIGVHERGRGTEARERGRGIGVHERGRGTGARERGRGIGVHERGRGTGSSRTVAKFTEEFDFAAMNEKFNKEEVWGDLGKNNKSPLKDKETDGSADDEYNYQDEDDAELSKVETKHVYNKDDFFDTISCNTLDRNSNGWTKFSEQRKIDTETFGEFARHRGGRGGRYRGGRGHGYGRGRGRGRSVPSRAS